MKFSLQTRFLVLIVLPVALIILVTATSAFFTARTFLFHQWIEAANAKLKYATKEIGCRLNEQLRLTDLIVKAGTVPYGKLTEAFLIQQLLQAKGVRSVDLKTIASGKRKSTSQETATHQASGVVSSLATKEPHKGTAAPVTVLIVNAALNYLEIVTAFKTPGTDVERLLTISVDFRSFIDEIRKLGVWKQGKALLITAGGHCLARTDPAVCKGRRFGAEKHPLEKRVLREMVAKDFGTLIGDGYPPEKVMGFHRVPNTNWYVVLYSKGTAISEPMLRFGLLFLLAVIAALVTVPTVIILSTRSVTRSIKEISDSTAMVEKGDYSVSLKEDRSDEIGQLKRGFNRMTEGLRHGDLIQQTFGRYMDKGIARELLSSPDALNLGGQEKTVTVMMSDLQDFTRLAEKLSPTEVIRLLNRYLARMIAVIERHSGIIVDFYGDGILVFFNGTETDSTRRAHDAIECASEMQRELKDVSKENISDGLPKLAMRIGIHTGEVIVGNIGSETRAKYGVVGSPVNLTQRIQSVARTGTIVISARTYEEAGKRISVKEKFQARLKGMDSPMDLYEVVYQGSD